MIIRKATLEDSDAIARYLLLAMEEIVYCFIGEVNWQKAYEFMLHFARLENNQYSWQNCLVAQEGDYIVGAVNVYDGARLHELRQPVIEYLRNNFHRDILPEDETTPGEYYIDTLAVDPARQGLGIGTHLLQSVKNEYADKNMLGILVDEDNPDAQRLYLRLGFKPVGYKTLMKKKMVHLQFNQIYHLR